MPKNHSAMTTYKLLRDQLRDALNHERNAWLAMVEGLRAGADASALNILKAEQHAFMRLANTLIGEMDQLADRHFG